MAKAKSKKSHLPSKPPKRTGKRGVGPKPEPDKSAGEPLVQAELPGMEERHLEDLESAALKYAGLRDRRMALLREEIDQKDLVLTLMHRYEKTVYRVAEMQIKVVPKDETVKVKLLKDDDEE